MIGRKAKTSWMNGRHGSIVCYDGAQDFWQARMDDDVGLALPERNQCEMTVKLPDDQAAVKVYEEVSKNIA